MSETKSVEAFRVLLVEDNHDTAESMMRAFEIRGFDARHAPTVAAALDAYEPDLFDVIVLDYELPDGTGLDFAAEIRGTDKAVTILSSGLNRDREVAESGMHIDHQVSKSDPFKLFDIIEAVRRGT